MSEAIEGTLCAPDFSEVQDRVVPGIYKARIVDAKSGQWPGKEGKKPTNYIAWRMETFGETEDKNNGRSIFHRTALNGPGAFRLQEFYRSATGLDLAGSFDYTNLYGCEVEVTIAEQKSDPQYTEVKAVRPISH
jgi:hypothetical protein